jgi:dihydrodipicolinate synthase/N-acetylneuraminate lyase
MSTRTIPSDYETKFANFIYLCERSKAEGVDTVLVVAPWVLGDTYDEVVESLSRLADAELMLRVTGCG